MSIDIERIKADAAAEERARILAVMSSPEAAANPKLAYELTYKQGRPAAEVLATLRVFASNLGEPADDGWTAVAEKLNAQAGLAKTTATASADDSWADVAATLNGEIGR